MGKIHQNNDIQLAVYAYVKNFMEKENLDFLIASATDEFLNEYIPLEQNSRFLLTGFSGSAGDALICGNKVYLFVDGRYHLQADEETDTNLVTVVKVSMDKSPQSAMYEKILELLNTFNTKNRIGVVSQKTSYSGYKKLFEKLQQKNFELVELDFDPIINFASKKGLTEAKKSVKSFLRAISIEISGATAEEKLCIIKEKMKNANIDFFIITNLEEIAYLTNLRGLEIPFSSSFRAKVVVNYHGCHVFTDLSRISEETIEKTGKNFFFKKENEFESFLNTYANDKKPFLIGYDAASINLFTFRLIEKTNNKPVEIAKSPILDMKSIKYPSELRHMQECFLNTDNAVTGAIGWLKEKLYRGEKISEKDFSDKVKLLFLEEGAVGMSFETIVACGENSAFIHYTKASPDKFIKPQDLVLLDCGAYFEGGYATDITRTFLAGGSEAAASEKQKQVYTTVLKAFLNGISFELADYSTGFDIDKKVREIIERNKPEGFEFLHGTGHGVGISVHESPPRLGNSDFSKTKLEKSMCFTIEPGIYSQGWGGVRIENTVYIAEKDGKPFIKSLSKAKLDQNLVNFRLLTEEEIFWFNEYNSQDYECKTRENGLQE